MAVIQLPVLGLIDMLVLRYPRLDGFAEYMVVARDWLAVTR